MQVDKQSAHFFGVTVTEEQAQAGIIVRVTSAAQSKFKVPKMCSFFFVCVFYRGTHPFIIRILNYKRRKKIRNCHS